MLHSILTDYIDVLNFVIIRVFLHFVVILILIITRLFYVPFSRYTVKCSKVAKSEVTPGIMLLFMWPFKMNF